jgi:hypothetical protein
VSNTGTDGSRRREATVNGSISIPPMCKRSSEGDSCEPSESRGLPGRGRRMVRLGPVCPVGNLWVRSAPVGVGVGVGLGEVTQCVCSGGRAEVGKGGLARLRRLRLVTGTTTKDNFVRVVGRAQSGWLQVERIEDGGRFVAHQSHFQDRSARDEALRHKMIQEVLDKLDRKQKRTV